MLLMGKHLKTVRIFWHCYTIQNLLQIMISYLNSTPYHYEIGIFDGSFNSNGYNIEDFQLSLSTINKWIKITT